MESDIKPSGEINMEAIPKYRSIIQDYNDNEIFKRVKRANGIYDKYEINDWNKFYRYKRMDPYRNLGTTYEYIFITRPDLHIMEPNGELNPQLAGCTVISDMYRRGYNNTVLRDLQMSANSSNYKCKFITAFTNLARSNVDLSSISSSDQETAANQFGTKLSYRKSSISSDEDADFTLEFEDSKYLEVYLWFKAYDEYQRRKFEGRVTPPPVGADKHWYITHRVLHDQMCLFKFIVGPDGETILHYSRITGIYPKNVNRDAFSDMADDGKLKITSQWHGTFVEDMEPLILSHFNMLCSPMKTSDLVYIDPWDTEISAMSGEDVVTPFIKEIQTNERFYDKKYVLQWFGKKAKR